MTWNPSPAFDRAQRVRRTTINCLAMSLKRREQIVPARDVDERVFPVGIVGLARAVPKGVLERGGDEGRVHGRDHEDFGPAARAAAHASSREIPTALAVHE